MTDQALTPSPPLPQGLMTRKPLADIIAEGAGHALGKTLGPFSLTALGIGCIIGAGIFVLTGTAAARYAGPGIMLSFVIGGIACAFVGLCYAELAALLPVAGSAYTYTYATLGEIFAWIIGWDLILEYAMGASTVAVGWSGYIASLLRNFGHYYSRPNTRPRPGRRSSCRMEPSVDGVVNLPAALIVLALTAMLIGGTKESARLNNIMVAVKLSVVVAFILLGAAYVTSANWHPAHSVQYRRVRPFRLVRRGARRLGRVLRLHRLRRRLDRRAGGQELRSATCRSASSARSSSARSSTCWWRP